MKLVSACWAISGELTSTEISPALCGSTFAASHARLSICGSLFRIFCFGTPPPCFDLRIRNMDYYWQVKLLMEKEQTVKDVGHS
jgi:hypothetical protein